MDGDIAAQLRLKDAPDWVYLLREFYEMYRFLPSGGATAWAG